MTPQTIELMHEQVRAIYRAITGTDLIVPATGEQPKDEEEPIVEDEVLKERFAHLDALARRIPAVGERVPPFSFNPPIDVIDEGQALVVEVAVAGVHRDDISVVRTDGSLEISGVRRGQRGGNGSAYVHAEIARGPFTRTIPVPEQFRTEPDVKVERGVILVRLPKVATTAGERPASDDRVGERRSSRTSG